MLLITHINGLNVNYTHLPPHSHCPGLCIPPCELRLALVNHQNSSDAEKVALKLNEVGFCLAIVLSLCAFVAELLRSP